MASANIDPERPLKGIRVLDFTRVLSGPFCTALLADMGAEIIKIESIDGDDYRHAPPYRGGESAFFLLINRGKKSVAVNLKDEAGRAVVRDLASKSDIVVENFKPGVTARLGIDFESLRANNPEVIYASISGFGQDGPLAENPAYDIIVQAASGLMQSTGFPGQPPTLAGEAVGDLVAGLFASWAIMVALVDKGRTGRGRYLDVAMFDCLLSMLPTSIAQFLYGGYLPVRTGNRHPISVPFGTYRAKDGYFVLAVLNEPPFSRLLAVVGRDDLKESPELESGDSRSLNEPLVRSIIEAWSTRHSTAQVLAELAAQQIPSGPIWTVEEALGSEQRAHRQLVPSIVHPDLGLIPVLEQPVHFRGLARGGMAPPPRLGEHTAAVLENICGLSDDAIAALIGNGVVGARQVNGA